VKFSLGLAKKLKITNSNWQSFHHHHQPVKYQNKQEKKFKINQTEKEEKRRKNSQ